LTGGSLPLAVTMAREAIYDAHLSRDRARMFFHSSSYTANPIACAAAVANLEVWQQEPVLSRIRSIEEFHEHNLTRFAGDRRFASIRQAGTIAALDIAVPSGGYLAEIGQQMRKLFRERNLLIRPLGNVIYLMPPYCVTSEELTALYNAIDDVASIVTGRAL